MERKMTSWTLNAVLASMAAAAVLLPSPDEIRKAIQYNQNGETELVEAAYSPEGSVEFGSRSPASDTIEPNIEIEYEPAIACLQANGSISTEDIAVCIPKLVDQIKHHDRVALTQKSMGRPVMPDVEIETARLAVINLCRANWVAQAAAGTPPDSADCQDVTVGVAY